jgi:hypothetical protein
VTGIIRFFRLVAGDFRDRTRRFSFLITLLLTLYCGYLFVPAPDAAYTTFELGKYRGLYNSAWIGTMMGLMVSTFVALIGFYLVKNSVERDRKTGVDQLLAATPLSRFANLASKGVANLAILSLIGLSLMITGIIMQVVRGEESSIQLWQYLAPFLYLALPALAVTAALAVLFEVIPGLNGAWGNVAYFFLFTLVMSMQIVTAEGPNHILETRANDITGMSYAYSSLQHAALSQFADYKGELNFGINFREERATERFVWNGINWNATMVVGRFIWFAVAAGLVGLASIIYRLREGNPSALSSAKVAEPESVPRAAAPSTARAATLPALSERGGGMFRLGTLIAGELRLAMRSVGRWWYLIALTMVVLEAALPMDLVRQWIVPLAVILPISILSALGSRDRLFGTEQLLLSTPHPVARQLPALWVTGLATVLGITFGYAIRVLVVGDFGALTAWLIGGGFVSSLALAAGIWSGSSRLFELLFTLWWYVGLMNHVPGFDFTGATPGGALTPIAYLLATGGLMTLAAVGQWRRLCR